MGKVKEAVRSHIRNGEVIACDVEADFAVIAGECLEGWPVGLSARGRDPALSLSSRKLVIQNLQRTLKTQH